MNSKDTRKAFLEYFRGKEHKIVSSAPIVNKNDPSLMFINAGMNQFKDYFIGNEVPKSKRITDTQKCLRVSGKHNDLEEVGFDGYHHTMFEMLGNWSFGDYFKEDAIDWAWEFLTVVLKVDAGRLYATVFEGDEGDNLQADIEAESFWKKHLPDERILRASKKDNFWEMGETGPCGPCSEIHIDLRSEEERKAKNGALLVNEDHPQVIEIWNLVFIQFNRNFDGQLNSLPEKHVDTGMGFERLCMVIQGKISSYDSDIFTPFIRKIEKITGHDYKGSYDPKALSDVAFRVVADHLRAVVFAIADGQIPGNTGAGYVIRRILRRAVRYYYSFLDWQKPLLTSLVKEMIDQMGDAFPELETQQITIEKVIEEEELSFLRTLEKGLYKLEQLTKSKKEISGKAAFELYDTYGFPIDLTRLIADEKGVGLDVKGFKIALDEQKDRSRADAKKEVRDWENLYNGESNFVGYDHDLVSDSKILKYRPFVQKGKQGFHIVLDENPFYAEGGGQIGDSGYLDNGKQKIEVTNTIRENDLFLLVTNEIFENPKLSINAMIDVGKRNNTVNNHTATHLLHAALKSVLGDHVQQKGSLVTERGLRFDFSHFSKLSENEILKIESIVNEKILQNIEKKEERSVDIEVAKNSGATMLFGEKYGDKVRVISFDPDFSVELCGGCHVEWTGSIGLLKIISDSSVAAGVRRIEAVTAQGALDYIQKQFDQLDEIASLFKNRTHLTGQVSSLIDENKHLKKEVDELKMKSAGNLKDDLMAQFNEEDGVNYLVMKVDISDTKVAKDLIFQLENQNKPSIVVFGLVVNEKPQLMCRISEILTSGLDLPLGITIGKIHAGKFVRSWAQHIKGGGGGQPFYATAGGSYIEGIDDALKAAEMDIVNLLKK